MAEHGERTTLARMNEEEEEKEFDFPDFDVDDYDQTGAFKAAQVARAKQGFKRRPFAREDFAIMHDAYLRDPAKPWVHLTKTTFPDRNAKTLSAAYAKAIRQYGGERPGRGWTKERDAALLAAREKYPTETWVNVEKDPDLRAVLRGKTRVAMSNRFGRISESEARWTPAQDAALLAAREKYPTKTWKCATEDPELGPTLANRSVKSMSKRFGQISASSSSSAL